MLLVAILLFVLITAGLAALTFENFQNDVTLSLFAWHTPPLSIGLLLMFAFCLGALVLYLLSATWAWRDARELKRLHLRVAELERSAAPAPVASSASPLEDQGSPASAPVVPMPGMSQPPPDISDMTTLH